jgi:hypothetical protein
MSNESGINEEIAVLEWKRLQKHKEAVQQKEYDALPKRIYVTYTGSENQFMHTGRSRAARRNPFHFQKGIPFEITQPEDIKFFMKQKELKNKIWNVEEMNDAKVAQLQAETLKKQAEIAEAQAKKLIAEQEALIAEAEKKEAELKKAEGDK